MMIILSLFQLEIYLFLIRSSLESDRLRKQRRPKTDFVFDRIVKIPGFEYIFIIQPHIIIQTRVAKSKGFIFVEKRHAIRRSHHRAMIRLSFVFVFPRESVFALSKTDRVKASMYCINI